MKAWILPCALAALAVPACTRHEVELDVKPIHITMDVNIKVQRKLDDFFQDVEEAAESEPPEDASKPAPPSSEEESP